MLNLGGGVARPIGCGGTAADALVVGELDHGKEGELLCTELT